MNKRTLIFAEEFCNSVRDGTHDSPKPAAFGRKLITSRHIVGGHLDLANAYLVSDTDFEAINRRSKVEQWDVLITMIGTVGEPCLIRNTPNFAIKNIGLFKSKSEAKGKWLYYWLKTSAAQQMIRERSAGTTQAYISLGNLRRLPVPSPESDSEMTAITSFLSALDDKIDVNRGMNETLEEMARAIFKDWFVDFGPVRAKAEGRQPPGLSPDLAALFPDTLDDENKPMGWNSTPLLSQATLISGGTPKTDNKSYWHGGIGWASAKDVSQCKGRFLIQTDRTITQRGLSESATRLVPQFSTVTVARGATTGRFCMFGREMAMNQTCYALHSKDQRPFWLYCAFGELVAGLVSAAHGSVFDTITTSTIEVAKVMVAPAPVLEQFEATTTPMFSRILANLEEAKTLAALRDLLLPKLMSGDIRIRDAEKAIEAAA